MMGNEFLAALSPVDRFLLTCTRQACGPEHLQRAAAISREEEFDWDQMFDTATDHSVAPLIYVNLQRCAQSGMPVPDAVLHRFKLQAARYAILKKRQATRLAKALAEFHEQGIEVMIIKGGALDLLVYEQPWYTVPHDVDLVLRATREEMGGKYVPHLDGYGIEYDFMTHHDIIMNGALPVDFDQIWADSEGAELQGQPVSVMRADDMLISLCINSCRKRYFRLKALCDIAETVAAYPQMDWNQLASRAKLFKVNYIVYTALLAVQMALGARLPGDLLSTLGVGPIRRRLIGYLANRSSLSAFGSLASGRQLFNRQISWQLLLPYASFYPNQIWRRLRFAWATRQTG